MKKQIYIKFRSIMLFLMLFVGLSTHHYTSKNRITSPFIITNNVDLSNQVVFSNFKITYSNGEQITSTNSISETTNLVAIYTFDWDLTSLRGKIEAKDFYTLELPNHIHPTYTQSTDIISNNIVIGTLTTNKNSRTITLTFNDKAKDMANYHGTLSLPVNIFLEQGDNTFIHKDGTIHTITYNKIPPTVYGEVRDEVLSKVGLSIYTNYIEWTMHINKSSQDFGSKEIIIEDDIYTESGSFVHLLHNQYTHLGDIYTFDLREVVFRDINNANSHSYTPKNNELIKVTTNKQEYDNEITQGNQNIAYVEILDGGQRFRLHLGSNIGTKSFALKYRTSLPYDDTTVINRATLFVDGKKTFPHQGKNGVYPTSETIEEPARIYRLTQTITYSDIKDRIIITKYDIDSGERLAKATFKLTYPDGINTISLTTGTDGTIQSDRLDAGTYTLTEITAPEGYILLKEPINVEVVYNKATFVNIPNKIRGSEPTYCLKSANTNETTLDTHFGITNLGRAGETAEDWPMLRKGGWVALESNTKPFVVTRTTPEKITNPENGMLIFDTKKKCLSLYDGTKWTCFSTPACPTE